ncbi:hypothetical protein CEQ15_11200 [Chryseobacterium indologenes]|uniref:DUF6520 family protein n=1 Tax=Chryseobacterium indologenes TaxID=253 RepID=UPI000B51587A|nr:DUF6520 family protein [Chryseobacterium indologenes]ASE62014.1 hypothetical protein CEQ15_11200 [Chryseobacterium indologenes]
MKNFKLLLGAAIVFAVGSAFTANNSAVDLYVKNGNTWELKSPDGECIPQPSEVCDYTKTGSATTPQYPNQFDNPANFTAHQMNARYEP